MWTASPWFIKGGIFKLNTPNNQIRFKKGHSALFHHWVFWGIFDLGIAFSLYKYCVIFCNFLFVCEHITVRSNTEKDWSHFQKLIVIFVRNWWKFAEDLLRIYCLSLLSKSGAQFIDWALFVDTLEAALETIASCCPTTRLCCGAIRIHWLTSWTVEWINTNLPCNHCT